ncbi:MAG: DinB family protein [Acidimicrobiales bacterium]
MTGPCPTCGLDPDTIAPTDAVVALRSFPRRWRAALSPADAEEDTEAGLRRRPEPSTWSALEHAGHVGEVLAAADDRIRRVLVSERPELPPVGDPDERVRAAGYNDRDVGAVLDALASGADRLARTVEGVPHDGWQRTGWRDGQELTVLWMARDAVHEGSHHLRDAGRALRAARGRP